MDFRFLILGFCFLGSGLVFFVLLVLGFLGLHFCVLSFQVWDFCVLGFLGFGAVGCLCFRFWVLHFWFGDDLI